MSSLSDGRELDDRLGVSSEECVVVTAAAFASEPHWKVAAASVLGGPLLMSQTSWVEWRTMSQAASHAHPIGLLLDRTSHPLASWKSFDHFENEWRFLRFDVVPSDFPDWLDEILGSNRFLLPGGECLSIGTGDPVRFGRALTHETSSTSRLAAGVGRPIIGGTFPLSDLEDLPSMSTAKALHLTRNWTIDGITISDAALALAGISSVSSFRPDGSAYSSLASAMLIGRVECVAWLGELRGAPDLDTFTVNVVRGSDRVMLWDLEVDIEERDEEGLVSARRLRLGDVELPAVDATAVQVALPTLGRGVTRRVRLFDRGGALLDGSDEFYIVGGGVPPALHDRLERIDRVDQEFASLLQAGAAGRIVAIGDDGVSKLAELLRAARGELSIFDPYFSSKSAWDVLEAVPIPIRILTGSSGVGPPQGTSMATPSIEVRRWAGSGRSPDFHDRAYLWDGGGLVVGTSPNGLGNRFALIDRLAPSTVTALLASFEKWWTSSDFITV